MGGLLAIALVGALMPATTAAVPLEVPTVQLGLTASMAAAPGVLGRVHRITSRSERALRRLAAVVSAGFVTGFWVLPSAALFLIVSAIASVVDMRMLTLRGQNPQMLARDLGHGVRMFFRILRDRRTPYLPRLIIVLALIYWLLPLDLVGDGIPVLGMLDDLAVAVLAAKLFIYLCPDAVVAAHAEALRASV